MIPLVSRLFFLPIILLAALVPPLGLPIIQKDTLSPVKSVDQPIDAALKDWLERFADARYLRQGTAAQREEFIRGLDTLAAMIYEISNNEFKKSQIPTIAQQGLAVIESKEHRDHPLAPYLIGELLRYPSLPKESKDALLRNLSRFPRNTCTHKQLLSERIKQMSRQPDVHELQDILDSMGQHRSKKFQKETLAELLRRLSLRSRRQHSQILMPSLAPWPKLKETSGLAAMEIASAHPVLGKLDRIHRLTRRGRCTSGRKLLFAGLKDQQSRNYWQDIRGATVAIDRCYRKHGSRSRVRYWTLAKKELSRRFGLRGTAWANHHLGQVYWGRDEFQKAYDRYEAIKTLQAESVDHHKELANYLVDYARILENGGELAVARDHYLQYLSIDPHSERAHLARQALVIIGSMLGDHALALKQAEVLVTLESKKSVDQRDAGILSFALFWSGRFHNQLGHLTTARNMWRRLAQEYYSTFYGALGHFMLERSYGQTFALEPSQTPKFDFLLYQKNLSSSDRHLVQRIDGLLTLGLRSQALCEIDELMDPQVQEQRMIAALYLNVAESWLSAVQAYSGLARSFRHRLPRGMESMLFPYGYSEIIEGYAEQLKVDPDYIYGIIRQESVFNPRARSPVGARGLMQLMPATARMEARRLNSSYVSRKERRKIIRSIRRRKKLYDPETNLKLGIHHVHSLMQRYQNPIYVLTAYNASPSATERWLGKIPSHDRLAFIERIPYRETRAYVKLVFRNYFYYKRWYGQTSEPLSHFEALDPQIFAKGPEQSGKS